MNFEIIVNTDITMKLLDESHAQKQCDIINKNHAFLREFLAWVDDTHTVEHAKEKIKKDQKGFESGESLELGIFYQGTFVGRCGFHEINKRFAEIGYWLDKDYNGKGIMTQCVKTITHYGLNNLEKHRIVIKMNSDNTASQSIPKRIGYTYEGTERESSFSADGKWCNIEVWSFIEGDKFLV